MAPQCLEHAPDRSVMGNRIGLGTDRLEVEAALRVGLQRSARTVIHDALAGIKSDSQALLQAQERIDTLMRGAGYY